MAPSRDSTRSTGASLPSADECHHLRNRLTRPLTVSTVVRCCPLLCFLFPDFASTGGGKSGFRRCNSLLKCCLKKLSPQLARDVPHGLLAGRNQRSRRSRIHRLHDLPHRVFHLLPNRWHQQLGFHLWDIIHDRLQKEVPNIFNLILTTLYSSRQAKLAHPITTYHSESLSPIPKDKPWTDRKNIQLVYSRNGTTWLRVGRHGAISTTELKNPDRDWKQTALDATFIPYGEMNKDWDWGTVSTVYTPAPIIVGDEVWMYYTGIDAKNWWTHTGEPPALDPHVKEPNKGVGLATLRLDGFVSVDADDDEGTLTTKPLVFFGDTLEINANAEGGSITVEALDAEGQVIEGFAVSDCTPITSNSVRHVVKWKDNPDCHLLQARPIRLRFHLKNAKLYAFEPRILHNHYLQSYE